MSEAIILLWNPKLKRPENLDEALENLRDGRNFEFGDWSAGATKNIPIGSRFFMLRVGIDPKGIFAAGRTTDEPWEEYRNANWVEIEFTSMLDVESGEKPLATKELLDDPILRDIFWDKLQSNGKKLNSDQTRQLEALWKRRLKKYSLEDPPDGKCSTLATKAKKAKKASTDKPDKAPASAKAKGITKSEFKAMLADLVATKAGALMLAEAVVPLIEIEHEYSEQMQEDLSRLDELWKAHESRSATGTLKRKNAKKTPNRK